MKENFQNLILHKKSLLEKLGVDLQDVPAYALFLSKLWAKNQELNLVSRKMTPEELVLHLIDSLLPIEYFPDFSNLADLGTGGGIPAFPLQIHFKEAKLFLYEKSNKKKEYLSWLRADFPRCQPYSEIPLNPPVDLITARAFKPLVTILDMTKAYYSNGGRYLLYKGTKTRVDEEILEAKRKYKNLNPKVIKLDTHDLGIERHIVLI
ncbi:MAG: class I SAM-dependent methyltransferase [Bdellovibrionales bacterium]|nr:class I SAM-dependent methyltransferase [Bdellovibrionales bacterium]